MSAAEVTAQQLRVLVALAEEGTFTDAAIRLRMSQPAVSRALTRLEQTLGVPLVHRTTRSLALSPEGQEVYRAALVALGALEDVARAARGAVRPLRLGYAWAAFGAWTSPILRAWREEFPGVPLEIHRIDDRDAGLARGRVDVTVRRGEVAEPGVEAEPIFDEGRLAAVPAGSPLAARASLTLADLTGETIALAPLAGTTTLDLWPPGQRPVRTVTVTNTDEWLLTIASGAATGVSAESTAFQHPHPGVRFVPLTGAPPLTVSLVWPAGRPHPAVPGFVALVHRCVAG